MPPKDSDMTDDDFDPPPSPLCSSPAVRERRERREDMRDGVCEREGGRVRVREGWREGGRV